jgi:hypothetical protein
LHTIGDSTDQQVASASAGDSDTGAAIRYGVAVRSDPSALRFFELALVETSRWCFHPPSTEMESLGRRVRMSFPF